MNIGIYKPFKPLYFIDDKLDNAAWSYEIVNFAQIMVDNGHTVHILSPNDLPKDNSPYKGITNNVGDFTTPLDRIVIWCGSFALDEFGDDIIETLRTITPRLDFMLTDYKLVPDDRDRLLYFDTIYVQATQSIYRQDDRFGALGELLCYKHEYKRTIDEAIKDKTTEFYFGGTERDRLDDFIEYVWRPGHLITTKTVFFNFENRIPRDEFMSTLDKAKYSIVITDVINNEKHFISPRPYELYIHDIVAFFDYKYDVDEHFCKKDSWFRVHNYKEMREKMNFLNNNSDAYKEALYVQRDQMTQDLIDGSYVYQCTK